MTLLEQTYTQLHSAGLVDCAETFSRGFLGKNRNWYAYQKHVGRDYSLGAAIQCLRNIRFQQRQLAANTEQADVLQHAEQQLADYLTAQHCIANVC